MHASRVHPQPRPGFTSVELTVSILAAGILILAGSAMVIYAYRAWHDHMLTATVWRDAGSALDMAARHVRAAAADELWTDGESLYIARNGDTSSFARSEATLVFEADGEERVLVPDLVAAFSPRVGARDVTLTLRLSGAEGPTEFRRAAAWRNGR